jgi:DNA-binding transcriptional LysR family regulator
VSPAAQNAAQKSIHTPFVSPFIHDLLAFVQVCRYGGLRQTEAATGWPKTSLVRQLDRLEDWLGVQLVVRQARNGKHTFDLTLAGEEFLPYAQEMLETLIQGMEKIGAEWGRGGIYAARIAAASQAVADA